MRKHAAAQRLAAWHERDAAEQNEHARRLAQPLCDGALCETCLGGAEGRCTRCYRPVCVACAPTACCGSLVSPRPLK